MAIGTFGAKSFNTTPVAEMIVHHNVSKISLVVFVCINCDRQGELYVARRPGRYVCLLMFVLFLWHNRYNAEACPHRGYVVVSRYAEDRADI